MVKFTPDMKISGFELIPAGTTILKVVKMKGVGSAGKIREYKAEFVDSKGRKIFNTYNINQNNQYYLQAMRSFFSLLKTGCGLSEDANDEIEPTEAEGKFFVAKIKHTEKGERTYCNLGYVKGHVESFDDDISKYIDDDDVTPEVKKQVVVVEEIEDEEDDDPYK